MMGARQSFGGIAALVAAASFVVGFALYATVLSDYTTGDPEPAESVAFLADNQATFYVWNLIIFIVFGIALVVLALAVHDRLRTKLPATAQTATAFGVIWAGLVIAAGMIANIGLGTVADLSASGSVHAEPAWLALDSVQNGLGGGNEIVGGIWVLLVSLAALRAKALPKALSYLGVLIAVAGLVTVVPALEAVGAIFGLGLIVWFAWLGGVMISDARRPSVAIDLRAEIDESAPRQTVS